MPKLLRIVALLLMVGLGGGPADAAAPEMILHQGVLTDSAGSAVADGSYPFTFTIYDADAGGSVKWSSGEQMVMTTEGTYSYLLGSNVPFPTFLFATSFDRWLGIQVNGDAEIAPRTQLMSAAYAIQTADAALAQSVIPDGVGTPEIADNSLAEQDFYQEDWIAPALINGWINYENGYNPAGYFKDINGVVHLRGLVRDGPNSVAIFQLPAGYRPEFQQLLITRITGGSIARVDVLTDGSVRLVPPDDAPGWLSLDGITFRADGN